MDNKWHYNKLEVIVGNDVITGEYYEYDTKTYQSILSSTDASLYDERNWLLDTADNILLSLDGTLTYVPTSKVQLQIECYLEEVY